MGGGACNEIWPEPEGNREGGAQGISRNLAICLVQGRVSTPFFRKLVILERPQTCNLNQSTDILILNKIFSC